MTAEAFFYSMTALLALATGAAYVLLLAGEWRYRRLKTAALLAIILGLTGAVQVFHYILLPPGRADMAATVMDAAIFLLVPVLSPWRRGRLLFVCAASYSFTFTVILFADLLAPGVNPANLAARAGLGVVVFLILYRWYAPCLHNVFRTPVGGWYILSLVPLLFGTIFFLLASITIAAKSYPATGRLIFPGLLPGIPSFAVYITLLVLPPVAYTIFYTLFQGLLRHYAVSRDYTVLNAHMTVMAAHQDRARRQELREEQSLSRLRIQLTRLEEQIRQGELDAALELALQLEGKTSRTLGTPLFRRYANDAVLNSVLEEYAALAEEAGISARFQFDLPQRLVLDRTALAVVLSNALENAVHACQAQPEGQPREIRLFTRNTPEQLFLQIENSCCRPVAFAPDTGLPVVRTAGHGYGTRSIAAFARRSGGSLRFCWREGVFQLQLLI